MRLLVEQYVSNTSMLWLNGIWLKLSFVENIFLKTWTRYDEIYHLSGMFFKKNLNGMYRTVNGRERLDAVQTLLEKLEFFRRKARRSSNSFWKIRTLFFEMLNPPPQLWLDIVERLSNIVDILVRLCKIDVTLMSELISHGGWLMLQIL